jgi:superfamily II RNA helicase
VANQNRHLVSAMRGTLVDSVAQWYVPPTMADLPPLQARLQSTGDPLDRFLDYVQDRGVALYPAQEDAILELYSGKNVILNTPTGSGKSLVAEALHFKSILDGKRSFYTSPIKALVNEKFLALCRSFGPEQVGMITGDASVNAGAPIICCTAEILSNDALRFGKHAPVHDVVMDEFHFYSDRDRGVAWQIPLLTLPNARFLLMSATLGDTDPFEKALTQLTGRETSVVRSLDRPVPLDFIYSEIPLLEQVQKLLGEAKSPMYLVHFTQRDAAESAQNFLSVDFCTKEEKKAISLALEGVKFRSPFGADIQRLLKHGIGIHHAGLLPRYRILVEKLAQKGLLKLIFGTDTLGVGVNVPIRTVVFTRLCKFDGQKTAILSVRDFQQISGRAGRKGFDDRGTVVAQAPEHVIENLSAERKAEGTLRKKKFVKKKPPEKGYVHWTLETFQKLVAGHPESLVSQFQVTHGMLLNVLSRPQEIDADPCRSLQRLIRSAHDDDKQKKRHRKHAFELFRSLVERNIIELEPQLRVNLDLQSDFSLNQTLALYLLDTLQLLNAEHPDYALDLLTLIESILENPMAILHAQLQRCKTERMVELKAQGMEFDQRLAELDKVEYPKPNREFIYRTYNAFSAAHPWVGQENIRPKSIAREMYEGFQSFAEYIRNNGLQRAEGLLLRYLSETYKVMVQTVPESAKSESVLAIEEYLGSMVRSVDSSLLDEWEKLRNPEFIPVEIADPIEAARGAEEFDITRDARTFEIMIRNEVFRFVRAVAMGDAESAAGLVTNEDPKQTESDIRAQIQPYFAEHTRILTDTKARAPVHLRITKTNAKQWAVEQALVDPEEFNDWAVHFTLDLAQARAERRAVLRFESVGPANPETPSDAGLGPLPRRPL